MEKLFIVCTFDCSFEYYEETIEKFVKEYGDGVVIDYDLNKINDHKSHSFYNVTSLEAFAKILDNPFAREWDKANNCKDIVYKLEGHLQIICQLLKIRYRSEPLLTARPNRGAFIPFHNIANDSKDSFTAITLNNRYDC